MAGKITKIENGVALVENRYGTFKVRLGNISSMDIKGDEPQQLKMNYGDARLTFYEGSRFIVQIKDIKGTKIFGTSQAFEGVQEFDVTKIKQIEFQKSIYP